MRTSLKALALLVLFAGVAAALELDQSPAGPREWGYRPADDARTDLTPPGFTWRPTDGAEAYTLQVAEDADFENIAYECEKTEWSAHCPSTTIEPGPYHWRYAAFDDEGNRTDWSKVREFTIPDYAVDFPKPQLNAQTIPSERPRLFFRPGDIRRIKRAADGDLSEAWKDIKSGADRLLNDPPDTSEPPKYPDGVERGSERWKEIWWGNRKRVIAVAGGAARLAFVYRVTGQAKYAEAARDLLVAMTKWDPKGSTAYRYNDEAAMPALYYTSRAYDWAYPALDESDRKAIIEMMRIRGEQCFNRLRRGRHLWKPYSSHDNRAWHFLGEVALAFHGQIPEADRWLDYAMTVFYTAYPVWSDTDGGWHEGVLYWASYLRRFMYWVQVMHAGFEVDVFKRPFFNRTGYYGMYVLPPGTQDGGFGDLASRSSHRSIDRIMAMLGMGARNPHWLWHAKQGGYDRPDDYNEFLFAVRSQAVDPRPPSAVPSSICFRGVGIAALNTNLTDGTKNVQLFFKSSPMGTISHGYNANNGFHLNVHGRAMLRNTGRRDMHGSPHHRKWMWQTKSQNAILVNGKGQRAHSPHAEGEITWFQTNPKLDIVGGEAGGSYENLDRWTRRIAFLKPHLLVIHDVLEAPEPSSYQWLLHAPGKFEIDGAHARYAEDERSVDVHFLGPEGLSITQTGEYDTPPAEWRNFDLNEWHLTAETDGKSKRMEFVTLIRVNGEKADWELGQQDDGKVLEITAAGKTATVNLGEHILEVEGWQE